MKASLAFVSLVLLLAAVFLTEGVTAKEVTQNVEARNTLWFPDTVTVDLGDVVTFIIVNNEPGPTGRGHLTGVTDDHTFELPDFGVSEILLVGTTVTVTVTVDKAGSFQYFCAVPGHASLDLRTNLYSGMAGDFIVNEPPAPPSTPGFEAISVVMALAVAFSIVGLRFRGRRK